MARYQYECTNCGKKTNKPYIICPGRLPDGGTCNARDSYKKVDQVKNTNGKSSKQPVNIGKIGEGVVRPLRDITSSDNERIYTGIGEFDRVLGGGIVPGSIILLGGEPGAGKSTILLDVSARLSHKHTVLYVSAEESEEQIKMRADRMRLDYTNLYITYEDNIEMIVNEHVPEVKPDFLIIDSVSKMTSRQIDSAPQSPSQITYVTTVLQSLAKSTGTSVFMISHVTKEGTVTGRNTLSHDVDTVLYLEGDQFNIFKVLRAAKNRFGAINEIALFEMLGVGLVEVPNPSEALLEQRSDNKPGSAVAIVMEGARPLAVEIQALTDRGIEGSNPARRTSGLDRNKLFVLASVINTSLQGVHLHNHDIIVSVVGGIRVSEPAVDLSMCIAIMSSLNKVPVPPDVVTVGEVGLNGKILNVPQLQFRIKEAIKLGFKKIVVPQVRRGKLDKPPRGVKIIQVSDLEEAIMKVFK